VAGNSLWTVAEADEALVTAVAEAEEALLAVRRKLPLVTPVPVRGTMLDEVPAGPLLGLVMVRVPGRAPRVVGVKVTVIVQVAPGASVVRVQGTVMA
jgi:hypothetical protein